MTMVERMIEAMSEGHPAIYREYWRGPALAALNAMRDEGEFFSAIVDGMNDVWVDAGDGEIQVCMADCRAMLNAGIDAAIAEVEQCK